MAGSRIRRSFGPPAYAPFVGLLARISSIGSDNPEWVAGGDEALLVEAALHHGVGGQTLAAVLDGSLCLAEENLRSLETGQVVRMVRGKLLREELRRVAPVICTASGGCPPILIKGPALADRFYADSGMRPFVDLDFLVPRNRVAAAASAVAEACGYTVTPLRWPQSSERHGHAIEMSRVRVRHNLGLDLHWRISDDPQASGLDYARLVTGADRRLGEVTDVVVCGSAAQLVLLATHLLHHPRPEQRLIWLLDVAAVARAAAETEWSDAFALAGSLGLGWVLHTALDETERHLGPTRSRPTSSPRPIPWGPMRAAHAIGGGLGFHLGHLATLGWGERAGYLARGASGRLKAAGERGLPKAGREPSAEH